MRLLPRPLIRLLALLWASPYSLIGLTVGALGLCTGGKVRAVRGILEFYGGAVSWCVRRLPTGPGTMAITLGHVVLGQTSIGLEVARDHELVHVRQYERWGFFMGPAYLLCSAILWFRGGRPYRDNPFEREAYDLTGEGE